LIRCRLTDVSMNVGGRKVVIKVTGGDLPPALSPGITGM
jgi:hypothetical protein